MTNATAAVMVKDKQPSALDNAVTLFDRSITNQTVLLRRNVKSQQLELVAPEPEVRRFGNDNNWSGRIRRDQYYRYSSPVADLGRDRRGLLTGISHFIVTAVVPGSEVGRMVPTESEIRMGVHLHIGSALRVGATAVLFSVISLRLWISRRCSALS